jgi:prevent-host-death family protein
MRTIPAGEFKAKCLKIMDEVAATGVPVVVTKRGKPVVRLEPPAVVQPARSIFGALRGMAEIVGDPDSLVDPIIPAEEWDQSWEPHISETAR